MRIAASISSVLVRRVFDNIEVAASGVLDLRALLDFAVWLMGLNMDWEPNWGLVLNRGGEDILFLRNLLLTWRVELSRLSAWI